LLASDRDLYASIMTRQQDKNPAQFTLRQAARQGFSPSSTNQTGIEIVFPDFLPIRLA
jgi:hypothetical protein